MVIAGVEVLCIAVGVAFHSAKAVKTRTFIDFKGNRKIFKSFEEPEVAGGIQEEISALLVVGACRFEDFILANFGIKAVFCPVF